MATGYYQNTTFAPPKPVNIPTFTPPSLNLPQVSTAPPPQSANSANAGQESFYRQQLDPQNAAYLGRPYEAQRANVIAQARQGLAGIGGFSIEDSGAIRYDPSAPMGEAQRQAVLGARAATSSKQLGSSIADRNIGAALGRVNNQALQVLNQYAAAMTQSYGQEGQALGQVTSSLLGLYGSDIQNALDNPPQSVLDTPAPAPEPPLPDLAEGSAIPSIYPSGPGGAAAQQGLWYGVPAGGSRMMF